MRACFGALFGAYRWLVHVARCFSREPTLGLGVPAPWSSFVSLKVALFFLLFSAGILIGDSFGFSLRPLRPPSSQPLSPLTIP